MLKAAGIIDDEELLTFRKLGWRLEGHPTPRIPPTDVATGSLGQGLPIAVGVALAGKRLDRLPVPRLVPVRRLRDGRGLDLGGVRARRLQRARQPDRDHRRQPARPDARDDGRLGPRPLRASAPRRSAGTRSRSTATTSTRSTPRTTRRCATTGKPTVIIAQTKKGKGVKAVEDLPGKHGKPLDDPDAAIEELGGERDLQRASSRRPRRGHAARVRRRPAASCRPGSSASRSPPARRTARRSRRSGRCAATSSRSTARSRTRRTRSMFREAHEDRYFEMFIAEQQMVAAAVGHAGARLGAVRVDVRGVLLARVRLRPHGGDLARGHPPLGLARGRVDRRGRPVADGARGHGVVPRDPRLDRAAPVRRQPDGAARRGDGRPRGDLVPPHAAREDRGAHAGRTRASTIGGSRVVREGDDVAIVACGITVDQAVAAAETLAGDGIARARDRRLLDQADRRGDDPRGGARVRRDRDGRGPLARGRARRRGARGARGGRRPPAGAQARGARDAGLGHARRAAALRPGSTPRASPTRRGRSRASASADRPRPSGRRRARPPAARS